MITSTGAAVLFVPATVMESFEPGVICTTSGLLAVNCHLPSAGLEA